MLHLDKVGAKLTKMSKDQADYNGVKPSDHLSQILTATKKVANDCKIFRSSHIVIKKSS